MFIAVFGSYWIAGFTLTIDEDPWFYIISTVF